MPWNEIGVNPLSPGGGLKGAKPWSFTVCRGSSQTPPVSTTIKRWRANENRCLGSLCLSILTTSTVILPLLAKQAACWGKADLSKINFYRQKKSSQYESWEKEQGSYYNDFRTQSRLFSLPLKPLSGGSWCKLFAVPAVSMDNKLKDRQRPSVS